MTLSRRLARAASGLMILLLIASCGSPYAETSRSFDDECWHIGDTITVVFTNDPELEFQVSLPIRFTEDYPFNNFWVGMQAIAPSGERNVIPYEYELMDVQGNWYGNGGGTSFNLPLSIGQKFPEAGDYTFRVYQFMQKDILCGISKAGLSVRKID